MQPRITQVSVPSNYRQRINTSNSKDSQKTIEIARNRLNVKEEEELERKIKPAKVDTCLSYLRLTAYSSQVQL